MFLSRQRSAKCSDDCEIYDLTEGHPVVLDSLVEHGGQPELGLLTDVGAADDESDPVCLVERDAHVWLDLGH